MSPVDVLAALVVGAFCLTVMVGLYRLGAFNAIGRRKVQTRKGETYRVVRETTDGALLCALWDDPSGWFDTWEKLAKELDGADAEWAKAKLEEKKARKEVSA